MSPAGKLTVTVRLDDADVLRLVAYREVLREIAKGTWSGDAVLAREVLAHFGDERP
ncbi:MAG: hypothetical protein ACPGVY_17060 [Mycobacterium sp.]